MDKTLSRSTIIFKDILRNHINNERQLGRILGLRDENQTQHCGSMNDFKEFFIIFLKYLLAVLRSTIRYLYGQFKKNPVK